MSDGSPCRGAGAAGSAIQLDIDGEPWQDPPSIGCDEYRAGAVAGPLDVSIEPASAVASAGEALGLTGRVAGFASASDWDFGDGTVLTNRPYTTHTWMEPGDYLVVFRARNESHPEGVSAAMTVRIVLHHVSVSSTNPTPPYASWETAARCVQDALDAAGPGGRVRVADGVYSNGGRALDGLMTNRVAAAKPVTLESVSGPQSTVIEGRPATGSTNGDGAIRCVWLAEGSVLSGFTLRNGATRDSGDATTERSGGGAWCQSTNVIITNCLITGCSASWGGGVFSGTLTRCLVQANRAVEGGGVFGVVADNCLLSSNAASSLGGGAGASALYNCTLAENTTDAPGGSVASSMLYNCVVQARASGNAGCDFGGSTFDHCFVARVPEYGSGSITGDPLFVDPGAGDFRLQASSPCINAGLNASDAGAIDLAGRPRVAGATVDIGAYEFQSPASRISYAWLQEYGLSIDGSADGADPDGDGASTWQEWGCGTNPTNGASVLRLLPVARDAAGVTLSWPSTTNLVYWLERSTNLGARPAFQPLAAGIPGQPGSTSYTDTNAPGPVFYRVSVRP